MSRGKSTPFIYRKFDRKVRTEGFHLIFGQVMDSNRDRVCKGKDCTTILRKERPKNNKYCSLCEARRIREEW